MNFSNPLWIHIYICLHSSLQQVVRNLCFALHEEILFAIKLVPPCCPVQVTILGFRPNYDLQTYTWSFQSPVILFRIPLFYPHMEATPSLSSQISLPSFLLLFYDVMRIRIMCCISHVNIRVCKCEWFIRDSATFCVVQLYTIISKTVFRFWLPRSSGLMFSENYQ